MKDKAWVELERKMRRLVKFYFLISMLLNVSKGKNIATIWNIFLDLYEIKSIVNKLFPQENMFTLRMGDGDSIAKHLSAFNTIGPK
jgi:hypothetical protein